MKKLLCLSLLFLFCSQRLISQQIESLNKDHSKDRHTLTDDFMTWYTYTYNNVHLAQDFIGLGVDSGSIDKRTFLNKLLNDKVFAFKIGTMGDKDVYKLCPLTSKDESIKAVINELVSTEIKHYKMEGKQIPAFSFIDINGTKYDNALTKGKLLVLKCWFVHCVACVKEFPELNKLVNDYKSNDNILFISLAIDKKDDLIKFLKAKKFKYAVVPEMNNFMENDLNVSQYPTHLLIDKTGKIVKVVNRIDDLVPFLEKASK